MDEDEQRLGTPSEDDSEQAEPLHDVATVEGVEVELPTVGRIVHFRIDINAERDDDPVLRPAIVLKRDTLPSGIVHLQVFLIEGDFPLPFGAGVASRNGNGYYATASFGPECGQWRWPLRDEPETFLAAV